MWPERAAVSLLKRFHGHSEAFFPLYSKLNLSKEGIFPVPEISITKTNAELMRNVSSMCSVWQTPRVISRKHVMFINTIWLMLS